MKRLIAMILLVVFLLGGCAQNITVDESTIVTRTGTVTDRAMAFPEGSGKIWDEASPYLGIEFEDGTVICIWNKHDVKNDAKIGDIVEVTYGLQENTDHWILIEIKEVS